MSKNQQTKPRKARLIEREIVETLGLCHKDGTILIDPRQPAREYLDTVIHEYLHFHFPALVEAKVIEISNSISGAVWKQGFRRIYK